MKKSHKIIYWIATVWLALGMTSTGLVQLLQIKDESTFMTSLAYPTYVMTLLGIWKITGAIAILLPRFPLLKEWAYAGFFFVMTGAIYSHLASGDSINQTFPSILLLTLTICSWYFRPPNRRLVAVNTQTAHI